MIKDTFDFKIKHGFIKLAMKFLAFLCVYSFLLINFYLMVLSVTITSEQVYDFGQMEDKKMRVRDKFSMARKENPKTLIQLKEDSVPTKEIYRQKSLGRKVGGIKCQHARKSMKYSKRCLQTYIKHENGPCKFIEHHHGETKKFMDGVKSLFTFYDHFYIDCFSQSSLTAMVLTFDDEGGIDQEGLYIRLGNTRNIIGNSGQPRERPNRSHQNHGENTERPVDLSLHRLQSRDSLASLLATSTSSGFNSLTVYEENVGHRTSRLSTGPNNIPFLSGASSSHSVYRPTISSGYESGRRGRVSSGPFSFSLGMQVDRAQYEDLNISHAGSIIPASDQNCSRENHEENNHDIEISQLGECMGEAAGYPPRLPEVSTIVRTTRQSLQATGTIERNAIVSLRENDSTESKKVALKTNESSSKSASGPVRNIIGDECPAQTSVQNLKQNGQVDTTFQGLGAHGTDSNQEFEKTSTVASSTCGLPHDLPNDRDEKPRQERRFKHGDITERSIHSSHRTNDHNHRNSTHYGNFDRIQHNAYTCRSPNQDNEPNQETSTVGQPQGIGEPIIHRREPVTQTAEEHSGGQLNQQEDDLLFGDGQPQIPNLGLLGLDDGDVDRDQSDSEKRPED